MEQAQQNQEETQVAAAGVMHPTTVRFRAWVRIVGIVGCLVAGGGAWFLIANADRALDWALGVLVAALAVGFLAASLAMVGYRLDFWDDALEISTFGLGKRRVEFAEITRVDRLRVGKHMAFSVHAPGGDAIRLDPQLLQMGELLPRVEKMVG